MPNVKTVKLTGGETAVSFDSSCPFVIITNMGDSEIYASNSSGITPYADGVYTVMAGVEICITTKSSCNTIYLLGSGAVQVRAEETAVPVSFKRAAKGGDTAIDIDLTDYVKNTTNSEIMTKYGVSVENWHQDKIIFKYNKSYITPEDSYQAERNGVGTLFTIPSASQYQAGVMTVASYNRLYSLLLPTKEIDENASDNDVPTSKAVKTFVSRQLADGVTGIKGEAETEYRTGNANISQSDIGLVFDGSVLRNKTVGEAKEIIINTYLSNFGRFGVFMNIPSKLIDEWDTNDYVLSSGSVCQITPIGTVTKGTADGKLYGRFLISGYFRKVYVFDISESVCTELSQILTSDDITLSSITDPNFDWDTITDAGFYSIDFEGGVTSNSHGPLNASSWGMLEVINTGKRIMQRYADISTGCYIRLRYNSAWRNWCALPYRMPTTSSVEMYELGNINMTVGEFKNLIYNWYCSGRTDKVSKIQGAVCNVTRNFIDYWSDDDYTLTPSTKWSIISIGAFQSNADTNMCCGLFLLSSYYNNVVYLLSLVNGVFNAPKALATSDGLLTNEERAKLDSITPEMIQKLKNL